MHTSSYFADRLAEMRNERTRAMTAARVARAFGCHELKQEMVDDAREQQYYILRAKLLERGSRLHVGA